MHFKIPSFTRGTQGQALSIISVVCCAFSAICPSSSPILFRKCKSRLITYRVDIHIIRLTKVPLLIIAFALIVVVSLSVVDCSHSIDESQTMLANERVFSMNRI